MQRAEAEAGSRGTCNTNSDSGRDGDRDKGRDTESRVGDVTRMRRHACTSAHSEGVWLPDYRFP
jgi:hypothetical protein